LFYIPKRSEGVVFIPSGARVLSSSRVERGNPTGFTEWS
jgi:hypothetical protein